MFKQKRAREERKSEAGRRMALEGSLKGAIAESVTLSPGGRAGGRARSPRPPSSASERRKRKQVSKWSVRGLSGADVRLSVRPNCD